MPRHTSRERKKNNSNSKMKPLERASLTNRKGTNRDGGRGASFDTVPAGNVNNRRAQAGAAFFGESNGSNTQTKNDPQVKEPGKPSL